MRVAKDKNKPLFLMSNKMHSIKVIMKSHKLIKNYCPLQKVIYFKKLMYLNFQNYY